MRRLRKVAGWIVCQMNRGLVNRDERKMAKGRQEGFAERGERARQKKWIIAKDSRSYRENDLNQKENWVEAAEGKCDWSPVGKGRPT